MENSKTKKCPFCSAEIVEDAKKCKFCGEWVTDESSSIPKEIRHFNWGAFLLNWIWGIMNKKWITLLILPSNIIPILGPLAMSVWFGIKGNRWAWESKKWESVETFNEAQKFWVRLWLVLFIFGTIILLKVILILAYIGASEA